MDTEKSENTSNQVDEITSSLQRISIDKPVVLENLTEKQKKRVEELKKIQERHLSVERIYEEEWTQLKAKYEKQYEVFYEQRKQILTSGDKEELQEPTGTPGVPNFWVNCLLHCSSLADMIQPNDIECLNYLRNIRSEWLDETKQESFQLIFEFAPNPFFTPETLVKTYHISQHQKNSDDEKDEDGPVFTHTTCTEILWKEGKNLTVTTVLKKQRNKRTKETRTCKREVLSESFFNFFTPQRLPNEEEYQKLDGREAADWQMIVEADYSTGVNIREKIIPRALRWYLGLESDNSDEEDDEYDDEDEDEYDDEDEETSQDSQFGDEDEEDDDEDVSPQKKMKDTRGRRIK